MVSFDPFAQDALSLAATVQAGQNKAKDLLAACLARVEAMNAELGAFITVDKAYAQQSLQAYESLSPGARGPLAGIPIALKDNISTQGLTTTCGSRFLANFSPIYDAHVVERLKRTGAIILGKTNLDEFAMGSSNENSAFFPARNPWDTGRVAGGSSGGSAVAVAAGLVPLALGSDTGGSVRQPASFCGIVGFKPTYGRVSRYGLVAYGSSLDQIGPMARTVKDAAALFDVIAGPDPRDARSLLDASEGMALAEIDRCEKNGKKDLRGLRVGVAREFFNAGLDPDVKQAFEAALAKLRELGAEVKEISLPTLAHSIATYYIIATAEASANLARFDGIRFGQRVEHAGASLQDVYEDSRGQGFGREVKQRIMLGTFVLSAGYRDAYYTKATRARRLITEDFMRAFREVDMIASPTAPTTAYGLGQKQDDPLSMYLGDIYTIGVNLAGIPAISVPCGFDRHGLPVGLQLMGRHGEDEKLFQGAFLYEHATQWYRSRQPRLGLG